MKTIKKLKGLLKAVVFAMLMVFVLQGCEKEFVESNYSHKYTIQQISIDDIDTKEEFLNLLQDIKNKYSPKILGKNVISTDGSFSINTDFIKVTSDGVYTNYTFFIERETNNTLKYENLVILSNNFNDEKLIKIFEFNKDDDSISIYNLEQNVINLDSLNLGKIAYSFGHAFNVPNCVDVIYGLCECHGKLDGHAPQPCNTDSGNCGGSSTTLDFSGCDIGGGGLSTGNSFTEGGDYTENGEASGTGSGCCGQNSDSNTTDINVPDNNLDIHGGVTNIDPNEIMDDVNIITEESIEFLISSLEIALGSNFHFNSSQEAWVRNNFLQAQQILNFLNENGNNTPEAQDFVLAAMENSANISFNDMAEIFNLSQNSPFNLDISQLNDNILPLPQDDSPEAVKLRCVFKKLTQSPKFKSLFVDTFGENININIGFEFSTDLPDSTNGKTVTTGTIINGNTTLKFKIKINKNTLLNRSNIGLARTIIHEAIHAFLITKKFNCQTGTSLPYLNNTELGVLINDYYQNFTCAGNQSQHEFMFNYMLPTIQNILLELKNDLIPSNNQTAAESITLYNESLNINENWNWENFFYYFSMNGLQQTSSFQNEISNNPNNNFLQSTYVYTGENSFSKVCN